MQEGDKASSCFYEWSRGCWYQIGNKLTVLSYSYTVTFPLNSIRDCYCILLWHILYLAFLSKRRN